MDAIQMGIPNKFAVHESRQSLFRVFSAHESKYDTSPELSYQVTPGPWVTMRFVLPNGVGDQPLRLDIASRPSVVDIATLSLRSEDGHTLWSLNPNDVSDTLQVEGSAIRLPEPEFFRVFAWAESPSVFLPILNEDEFQQPLELEIRMRVDLDLSAVKDMNQKVAFFQQDDKKDFKLKKLSGINTVSSGALEAAVAQVRAEAAKHLAQSRIEHEAKLKQATGDADAQVKRIQAELQAARSELDTLRSRSEEESAQLTNQLTEEKRSHKVTSIERDNLKVQQPRLIQEVSIAQRNVEDLKAELERLHSDMANLEFDLSEVRKLNARMSASLDEERSRRIQMEASAAWRMTKPLRAIGGLFGSRKRY